MRVPAVVELFRQAISEWNNDKVPQLGAALAYYSVFSLAPLLLIAIGIAGLVFGPQAAQGGIVREIRTVFGDAAGGAIEDLLRNSHEQGHSRSAALAGLSVLLFGASGVFIQLQDALNTIWKVQAKPDRGWLNIIRDRFLSFGVVLATGFLLFVSLIASAALTALSHFFSTEALPGGVGLWQGINGLLSFALITVLFAFIFKILPDVRIAWRDVWLGAAVTALLFSVGKYLIGLYLGQSSVSSAFGAAGSLVILLLWVYYTAQILLFGAEFIRVYTVWRGVRIVPTENAVWTREIICHSPELNPSPWPVAWKVHQTERRFAQTSLVSPEQLMTDTATASRILIIEDDEVARVGLASILENQGFCPIPAANGEEALELLRAGCCPDLILLDMIMPGFDGWQFMGQRQRKQTGAPIPVVVMTGLGIASKEWALALGAVDLLRKPIDMERLLGIARRFALRRTTTSDSVQDGEFESASESNRSPLA
jgi:membrane protein